MNITLSQRTQKLLKAQMKKRRFATPEDAVHTALRARDELRGKPIEELDETTQAALGRAFAQSERGQGRTWADVRRELKAKLSRK